MLAACATVPPDRAQLAEWAPWGCRTLLERGQTTWCLTDVRGRGTILIRHVAGGVPELSETLPIPYQHVTTPLDTLAYGFNSLWLSYFGWPMGVLRINPDSLAIQAQIAVESDQFSSAHGSKGSIAVGETAVWALSGHWLSRIEPSSNRIDLRMVMQSGLDIAAGPGVLWVAGLQSVLKIEEQTLEVVQTFSAPEGTHISTRLSWGSLSPGLEVSGETVRVPLGITHDGMFSFLTCASNCPASLFGTVNQTNGTIDIDPDPERH